MSEPTLWPTAEEQWEAMRWIDRRHDPTWSGPATIAEICEDDPGPEWEARR
jgi:hypothetical protein